MGSRSGERSWYWSQGRGVKGGVGYRSGDQGLGSQSQEHLGEGSGGRLGLVGGG